MKIKCGFCIAYDWELLRYSLPIVYPHVHSVCLTLDRDRISWSGKKFDFDETSFFEFVRQMDIENKISVLEDTFFLPSLTPSQNEVRQRRMMADKMGHHGWHMQLDVDEYLLEAEKLQAVVASMGQKSAAINICAQLITLFKKTENGFMVIDNPPAKREFVALLTNAPFYTYGRQNGARNIYANILLLHQSWAREPKEIAQKLESWGHVHDFDVNKFYSFWEALEEDNFSSFKNYHPLVPEKWESLAFTYAKTIKDLFRMELWKKYYLPSFHLALKNSKVLSKIRFVLDRLR